MNILITGAYEGLGQALAKVLSARGHAITGIDRQEIKQSPFISQSRRVDLADMAQVRRLAREGLGAPFDWVVLNAGISAVGEFAEIPDFAHERVLAVNLRAPIALANGLVANGHIARGGKIIFISSLSHATGYPGAAVYAASKSGLAIYAKSARKDFTAQGVSLLTVFPGPIDTNHGSKYAPSGARADKRMNPERLAEMIARAAMGRARTFTPLWLPLSASVFGRLAPKTATKLMRRLIFDKLQDTVF